MADPRNKPLNITISVLATGTLIGFGVLGYFQYQTMQMIADKGAATSIEQIQAVAEKTIQQREDSKRDLAKQVLLDAMPAAVDKGLPEGRHIYGNPDARYTIVEFSDYDCPYCQRFHTVPRDIVEDSGGNVNWEFLHYPLEMHGPGAIEKAHAAECIASLAGNKAFWAYTEAMFSNPNPGPAESLAEDLGVDRGKFQLCMRNPATNTRVEADMAMGDKVGVTGTPASVIVDNQSGESIAVAGALPKEAVINKLRQLVRRTTEKTDAPNQQSDLKDGASTIVPADPS